MNSQAPSTSSSFPVWMSSWRSATEVQPSHLAHDRQNGVREKDTRKEIAQLKADMKLLTSAKDTALAQNTDLTLQNEELRLQKSQLDGDLQVSAEKLRKLQNKYDQWRSFHKRELEKVKSETKARYESSVLETRIPNVDSQTIHKLKLEVDSLSHQKSKLEETCAIADMRIAELLADLDNEKDVIRDLEDQLEVAQKEVQVVSSRVELVYRNASTQFDLPKKTVMVDACTQYALVDHYGMSVQLSSSSDEPIHDPFDVFPMDITRPTTPFGDLIIDESPKEEPMPIGCLDKIPLPKDGEYIVPIFAGYGSEDEPLFLADAGSPTIQLRLGSETPPPRRSGHHSSKLDYQKKKKTLKNKKRRERGPRIVVHNVIDNRKHGH